MLEDEIFAMAVKLSERNAFPNPAWLTNQAVRYVNPTGKIGREGNLFET